MLIPTDIQVGDCIQEFGSGFYEVDCTTPHDREVFAKVSLLSESDNEYPAGAAFESRLASRCDPAFQAYTGSAAAHTGGGYTAGGKSYGDVTARVWLPSRGDWEHGADFVECYLVLTNGGRANQSRRASPTP